MTIARCGSQMVISAPIEISLSTKNRRFSNIFSKISTEPSDWVASATRDRGEVGGEGGPRPVLDLGLVVAGVALAPRAAGPRGRARRRRRARMCRPSRRKTSRIMRRSSGTQPWMRSSPPVTPASAMKEAISMWSGETAVLTAAELGDAVDVHDVRADPLDRRAHAVEHAREVLHVRLGGRVADDGRAGRERRGHERVLGAHHRRLVHEEVARHEAAVRGVELDVAAAADDGAERAEGVEVGVEPAAADHVAARRGHQRGAEAGQQRPGGEERGADALGQLGGQPRWCHPSACRARLLPSSALDLDAEALEQAEHRLDVADAGARCAGRRARTVSRLQASSGSAAFLLPAGTTVPDSGTPPSMTNFSMRVGRGAEGRESGAARPWRLG